MSSLAVWNHPADLICFCPKQQLSYYSCDNCLIIAITTFPDSCDSLFRTDVTANPTALALLIFHIWLKPKPTKEITFLLLKYFPFLLLLPHSFYLKQQEYLKAKYTIFGQILRWILWKFIAIWDKFWLIFFAKIPL